MPRGRGRVASAIEAAFTANPSIALTIQELALLAYPGIDYVKDSHRVMITRHAGNVAARCWWSSLRSPARGGPIIFCNLLDVRSYALGHLRTDPLTFGMSMPRLENLIDNPRHPMSVWEKLQPGGAFWHEVEMNKARREGRLAGVDVVQVELPGCD